MINQVLGSPGSFSLRLGDHTPLTTRLALNGFDHILIAPGMIGDPAPTLANLYKWARYLGRIESIAEDRTLFEGTSVLSWLGDGDSPPRGGWDPTLAPITAPKTWTQFVNAIFSTATRVAGLTVGTFYSAPGTVINGDNVQGNEAPRAFLNRAAKIVSAEFRVNFDGTFDSGVATALWKSGANIDVLFARGLGGRETTAVTNLPCSTFKVRTIAAERVGREFVQGTGVSFDSGVLAGGKGIDGTTDFTPCKYLTTSSTNVTDLANYANSYQTANGLDRVEITVTVDEFDVGQYFTKGQPGDWVMVYSPNDDVYDHNQTHQIIAGGESIAPSVDYRVVEMSTPIQGGMSVWGIPTYNGITQAIELTDYVVFDSAPSTLKLSNTIPVTFAQALNGTGGY